MTPCSSSPKDKLSLDFPGLSGCDSCPRVPLQSQPLQPRTETPHEPVQAPESQHPEIY